MSLLIEDGPMGHIQGEISLILPGLAVPLLRLAQETNVFHNPSAWQRSLMRLQDLSDRQGPFSDYQRSI